MGLIENIANNSSSVNNTLNSAAAVANNSSVINTTLNSTATFLSQNIDKIPLGDPNWFYSTVAQCSAAIIGLMGAILITKLVNLRAARRQLQIDIDEHRNKMDWNKDEIAPKELLVKRIDDEDDEELVDKFLQKQLEEIDTGHPPTIDQLFETAKSEEEYEEMNKEMLGKKYTPDWIEKAREKQANLQHPFGRLVGAIELPNIIGGFGIPKNRYGTYNVYKEDIRNRKSEISYHERVLKEKIAQLGTSEETIDLKRSLLYLAIFSIIGLFLPLWMLIQDYQTMMKFRPLIFFAVLVGWFGMIIQLSVELWSITKQKK